MPLSYNNTNEFSASRQEEFEALRTKNVPRYLFAAWSAPTNAPVRAPSGQFVPVTKYTETSLVPAGFFSFQSETTVQGVEGTPFYDQSEANLLSLANAHINGLTVPPTEFSTWTASLLGALFHAARMVRQKANDVKVTMIDTKHLDGGALIWYAPDLLGDTCSLHEYLAHGPVRGEGFKTATWKQLTGAGLLNLIPEVQHPAQDKYGLDIRAIIFQEAATVISPAEIANARRIAALFGYLEVPAAIILLTMKPRTVTWESGQPRYTSLNVIFHGLGGDMSIAELAEETWLNKGGMVYQDTNSRDIREWMNLLYALACVIKIRIVV